MMEVFHKINPSKHEVDKVYVAKIKGVPTKRDLLPLAKGIRIDGKRTAPPIFKFFQRILKQVAVSWN